MIARRISEELHQQIEEAQERIAAARNQGNISTPPEISSEDEALNDTIRSSDSSGPAVGKLLFIFGGLAVVLPVLAFVLGLILNSVIPGCHVDEGAGGSGCVILFWDVSGAVAFLELGGFVGMILGVPIGFLLALVAGVVCFFEGGA